MNEIDKINTEYTKDKTSSPQPLETKNNSRQKTSGKKKIRLRNPYRISQKKAYKIEEIANEIRKKNL